MSYATEPEMIQEGWCFWPIDTFYLGEQWSFEDKQRMGTRRPLTINMLPQFKALRHE